MHYKSFNTIQQIILIEEFFIIENKSEVIYLARYIDLIKFYSY